jgi:hypothetical protein
MADRIPLKEDVFGLTDDTYRGKRKRRRYLAHSPMASVNWLQKLTEVATTAQPISSQKLSELASTPQPISLQKLPEVVITPRPISSQQRSCQGRVRTKKPKLDRSRITIHKGPHYSLMRLLDLTDDEDEETTRVGVQNTREISDHPNTRLYGNRANQSRKREQDSHQQAGQRLQDWRLNTAELDHPKDPEERISRPSQPERQQKSHKQDHQQKQSTSQTKGYRKEFTPRQENGKTAGYLEPSGSRYHERYSPEAKDPSPPDLPRQTARSVEVNRRTREKNVVIKIFDSDSSSSSDDSEIDHNLPQENREGKNSDSTSRSSPAILDQRAYQMKLPLKALFERIRSKTLQASKSSTHDSEHHSAASSRSVRDTVQPARKTRIRRRHKDSISTAPPPKKRKTSCAVKKNSAFASVFELPPSVQSEETLQDLNKAEYEKEGALTDFMTMVADYVNKDAAYEAPSSDMTVQNMFEKSHTGAVSHRASLPRGKPRQIRPELVAVPEEEEAGREEQQREERRRGEKRREEKRREDERKEEQQIEEQQRDEQQRDEQQREEQQREKQLREKQRREKQQREELLGEAQRGKEERREEEHKQERQRQKQHREEQRIADKQVHDRDREQDKRQRQGQHKDENHVTAKQVHDRDLEHDKALQHRDEYRITAKQAHGRNLKQDKTLKRAQQEERDAQFERLLVNARLEEQNKRMAELEERGRAIEEATRLKQMEEKRKQAQAKYEEKERRAKEKREAVLRDAELQKEMKARQEAEHQTAIQAQIEAENQRELQALKDAELLRELRAAATTTLRQDPKSPQTNQDQRGSKTAISAHKATLGGELPPQKQPIDVATNNARTVPKTHSDRRKEVEEAKVRAAALEVLGLRQKDLEQLAKREKAAKQAGTKRNEKVSARNHISCFTNEISGSRGRNRAGKSKPKESCQIVEIRGCWPGKLFCMYLISFENTVPLADK